MQHVIIIHGWGNTRAEDHWQRHLAVALRGEGRQVYYPQLPDSDLPSFDKWQAVLVAELEMIAATRSAADEVVVVAHSLGCSTWLRLATDGLLPLVADRLILVAPAEPDLLEEVPSFQIRPNEVVALALKASAASVTLLGSDADSWSPRGIQATYGEPLGIEPLVWPGVKHLALADGFGRWQGIIDWVLDPQAKLTVR